MRRLLLLLIVLLSAVVLVNCAAGQAGQKAKRVPLERSKVVLRSPATYEKRAGLDPKTGKEVVFDPRPRIEVVDTKAGKYAFKWIGYDGKEKVIAYQRADAIDAVVSVSVTRTQPNEYVYTYRVENLPSSGTYLSHFIVQNFAPDTKPIEVNGETTTSADLRLLDTFRNIPFDKKATRIPDIFIGQMSNAIFLFKEGGWIAFAPLPSLNPQVTPGRSFEVKMVSAAPPGLVGCSVTGGESTLQGVGEEMPAELDAAIPGYEEFPRGYTIGPQDSLRPLTATERARYILDKMPQLEKLGWITPSARSWYEKNLTSDTESVLRRAQQDLNSEQISSEVFAMIQAMKP